MKLYYSPGACSLSPHITLIEAGIAFEAVRASTKTHQLDDGSSFYDINPLGYVPVLELDDGTRLREGPVIVQYIADQVPTKQLVPANGTLARYRLQEWLTFISTELHKGFGPLFRPDTPDAYKESTKEKLLSRLKWLDGELAGRDFLSGETFSVADAYLFTVLSWAPRVGIDLSPVPNVQAYHARMAERPAVKQALATEKGSAA